MPLARRGRRRGERAERRGTPADLLVVGLGNPGPEYEGTRHNVGAETVGLLAERHGGSLRKSKELALVDVVRIDDRQVALAFPQTFMNHSGQSVRKLVRRFGIDDLGRLVVVHDELDLPPGRIKVKAGGGLAGHNGLKSIMSHLHSDDFLRVRIGVGKPPSKEHGADHVLRVPPGRDRDLLEGGIVEAADAVEVILATGVSRAMEQFNADRAPD